MSVCVVLVYPYVTNTASNEGCGYTDHPPFDPKHAQQLMLVSSGGAANVLIALASHADMCEQDTVQWASV